MISCAFSKKNIIGFHTYLRCVEIFIMRYSTQMRRMECLDHRKYFPIGNKIQTIKNYGKNYNTPIPRCATLMD